MLTAVCCVRCTQDEFIPKPVTPKHLYHSLIDLLGQVRITNLLLLCFTVSPVPFTDRPAGTGENNELVVALLYCITCTIH